MSNGRRCLTALVEDEFLTNVIIKTLQEIVRGLCVCSAGLPLRLGIACRHILARRLPPKISEVEPRRWCYKFRFSSRRETLTAAINRGVCNCNLCKNVINIKIEMKD